MQHSSVVPCSLASKISLFCEGSPVLVFNTWSSLEPQLHSRQQQATTGSPSTLMVSFNDPSPDEPTTIASQAAVDQLQQIVLSILLLQVDERTVDALTSRLCTICGGQHCWFECPKRPNPAISRKNSNMEASTSDSASMDADKHFFNWVLI